MQDVSALIRLPIVLDKIIVEFRGLAHNNFEFHLNHEVLLQVLLQRVPASERNAVMAVLSEVGTGLTASQARDKLLAGSLRSHRAVADELEQCMICGEGWSSHRFRAALNIVSQIVQKTSVADWKPSSRLATLQFDPP